MERQQTYELLVLTPLLEREEDRVAVRERVTKHIATAGGAVIAVRDGARQRLAYPVADHVSGEYTLVEFAANGSAPAAITRELGLDQGILRFMCAVKREKARAVGAEVEAMERAKAQRDAARAASAARADAPAATPTTIENLDEKLEEILGKEMI